ncbi:MAG: hypothetical protein LBV71_08825 [Prevotella sp.]|jgi:hypothetical protein|nr:hypothetical protein [Prevotella sp.]
MAEIIAILTQKGNLSRDIQGNTTVNIFELENDKVKGVESLKLDNTENNYFSLLMALKRVSIIYTDSINNDLKNLLSKIGIKTKCRDELNDDKFINQFIFG